MASPLFNKWITALRLAPEALKGGYKVWDSWGRSIKYACYSSPHRRVAGTRARRAFLRLLKASWEINVGHSSLEALLLSNKKLHIGHWKEKLLDKSAEATFDTLLTTCHPYDIKESRYPNTNLLNHNTLWTAPSGWRFVHNLKVHCNMSIEKCFLADLGNVNSTSSFCVQI